jgi:hypothetical protein
MQLSSSWFKVNQRNQMLQGQYLMCARKDNRENDVAASNAILVR